MENQNETVPVTKFDDIADDKLREWLSNSEDMTESFLVRVYKKPKGDDSTSQAKWPFMKSFKGIVPEEETLGELFGGGVYRLRIEAKTVTGKKKDNERTKILGEHWDEIAAEKKKEKARIERDESLAMMPAIGLQQPVNPMTEVMSVMREMMSIFLPVITGMQQQQSNSNSPDAIFRVANKMLNNAADIQNDAIRTAAEVRNEQARMQAGLPYEGDVMDDSNVEPQNEWVEMALGIWNKYKPFIKVGLDHFLKDKGTQDKVRGMEEVKLMQENPELADAFAGLAAEDGISADVVSSIRKVMGI